MELVPMSFYSCYDEGKLGIDRTGMEWSMPAEAHLLGCQCCSIIHWTESGPGRVIENGESDQPRDA